MSNPIVKFFRSKLKTAVVLLIFLIFAGIVGFKYISGYSWMDAIYMTVITITPVGYTDVEALDHQAKIFIIGLILSSAIILAYALKVISEYIISKNNINEFKQMKMQKKINALSEHVIICGYGRNGRQAAKKLHSHQRNFVVIDKDETVFQNCENKDFVFTIGDANEDEVLIRAGINNAACLICALPNDSENVFVVLSARQINPKIHIISRASEESSYSKLKLAGANNVILPDRIGGNHMASLVVVPDLLEFIDNLSIVGEQTINIEEIAVEKLCDTSKQKTILELDLRKKTGCNVIGYKDENGNYLINPEASQKLVIGSKIIVLGRSEQIQTLNSMFNIEI